MLLKDYFEPLNFYNFSIFILFFFAMDSVGYTVAYFLKFPAFLRFVNWIFGLGFFIFIWFLLHLFLPFRADYVAISIILFVLPFLPFYITNKGLFSLIKEVLKFPYPLIFILLIAQKLFFLISMPPYVTDEIAYHFTSPAQITARKSWDFYQNISLYYMLPQTLETGFRLMFSLTNTHAAARLLHFTIFLTTVYSISIFLKERVNLLVAIAYSFFTLLLFAIPLVDSTRGYIDVAPAILSNLLLVTCIGWIAAKERGYLYAAFSLIGLIVGIKYTVLGFAVSAVIFFLLLYLYNERSNIKNYLHVGTLKNLIWLNRQALILIPLLVITMGGYWYLKNLIVTYNPIYPFYFKCKDNIPCGNKNEFFGEWGVPFRLENWPKFLQVAQETLK